MRWLLFGKCAPFSSKAFGKVAKALAEPEPPRQARRNGPRRRLALQFDLLEDRITPALFLQGQVLNDVTLTPLPNAVVTLEDSAGNPILHNGAPITTTTDAGGNYRFDDTNTFGALVAGATYRLVETSPPGFANDSL